MIWLVCWAVCSGYRWHFDSVWCGWVDCFRVLYLLLVGVFGFALLVLALRFACGVRLLL